MAAPHGPAPRDLVTHLTQSHAQGSHPTVHTRQIHLAHTPASPSLWAPAPFSDKGPGISVSCISNLRTNRESCSLSPCEPKVSAKWPRANPSGLSKITSCLHNPHGETEPAQCLLGSRFVSHLLGHISQTGGRMLLAEEAQQNSRIRLPHSLPACPHPSDEGLLSQTAPSFQERP